VVLPSENCSVRFGAQSILKELQKQNGESFSAIRRSGILSLSRRGNALPHRANAFAQTFPRQGHLSITPLVCSAMNPSLTKLLPAIVAFVAERRSYVTKTKLLKLLYLFDLEWYRIHGTTFTGFDWIFHLLGPWTSEYDPVLDVMYANEHLRRRSGNDNFDTEFIATDEKIFPRELFDSREDERILENVLLTWADKTTPEILDYVYFRTEPMVAGRRGERLDFTGVSDQPPVKYVHKSSRKEEIDALRAKIKERLNEIPQQPKKVIAFTPPHYDDEFFNAMDKLESMK
jgi:hypothetical protein